MAEYAQVYSTIPEGLLKLLGDNLPYSLPLLRRIQFTKFEGGLTKTARIILVSEHGDLEGESTPQRFSAAYLDIGGGPDTQMWVYSTVEKPGDPDTKETIIYERQLARLVDEAIGIAKEYNKELAYPGAVLQRQGGLRHGKREPTTSGSSNIKTFPTTKPSCQKE